MTEPYAPHSDYYGRMCKSAFSALMYDKINWNDTRFLLQFVINMRCVHFFLSVLGWGQSSYQSEFPP